MAIDRRCSKCGVDKNRSEFFKDSKSKDRLRSSCKECDSKKARERYIKNKEKILARQKEYYRANQQGAINYARQWRKDNPDRCREYHRVYAERYSEKERQRHFLKSRRYALENPEAVRLSSRRWSSKNKEKVALKNANRRAKTREFLVTEKDIARIYAQPCSNCELKEHITLDHIVPLARGGNHSVGNFQPLCRSCNSSKGAKLMMEWKMMQSRVATME